MGEENDTSKRQLYLSSTGDGLLHRQPFLPDELVFEILSRLPVKSLLQYKCVSKSWKTLISDPQFTQTHLRNLIVDPTINHQRFFYSPESKPSKIASIPVKPLFENLSEPPKATEFSMEHEYGILGSCNGLLCLFSFKEGYVTLLNPSIEWKSKISPTLDSYEYHKYWITYHGFGYDHVNDRYKVLAVVCVVANGIVKKLTQIHTFGENSWTSIPNFPSPSPMISRFSWVGKFVSGTLNWVIIKTGVIPKRNVILSFDLAKETYKEVLLPEPDGVDVSNHVLGVLSNCLCVCFDSNKTHSDFWLMKKYGVAESWTRLMMIPLNKIWHCLQSRPDFIQPLFMSENSSVLLRTYSKFLLYNLNNGRLDCLQGYNEFDPDIYHESLVSPKF
ncbi:putative F-box domain-containing protein [Medicago truncatula]|uniref:F-box protein interaction domain protein n=1 Tax=Medicago truncatula TaxID=3880 RepID=A0A072V805_MEDTR|nr:F-box protein interaction domain protein [Medicago truncatula]RHN73849.1 putative F-box domain-containing protein [Medicago truncatula]